MAVDSFLLPYNSSKTSFHGFIQSSTSPQSYELCVSLPERGDLKHARLEVDWKLRELFGSHLPLVQKRLEFSSSMSIFMLELQSIIDQVERKPQVNHSKVLPSAGYHNLTSDLRSVGWQNIVHVSPELTQVTIMTHDKKGRQHLLKLKLSPEEYPKQVPQVTVDAPQVFHPKWSSLCGLVDLVKQFTEWLTQFETFWDTLDEIDANTWVLEPERPTRADTYRRVVVGHNLSICLVIQPTQPLRIPECTFLGPDHEVIPLKKQLKLTYTSKQWNHELSLLSNLSAALKLQFPTRKIAEDKGMVNECDICYAYQLNGCVPDITCDHCDKPFHYDCLFEWLKSLNVGKHQKSNSITGECPYCCKRLAISCKGQNSKKQ